MSGHALSAGALGAAGDPVVVWGAGAMGGSIGAALATAGREVVFVDVDEAREVQPQVERYSPGSRSPWVTPWRACHALRP